jgi:hypothetical protein
VAAQNAVRIHACNSKKKLIARQVSFIFFSYYTVYTCHSSFEGVLFTFSQVPPKKKKKKKMLATHLIWLYLGLYCVVGGDRKEFSGGATILGGGGATVTICGGGGVTVTSCGGGGADRDV